MAKKGQVQASKMQKQDKSRTYKGYELKILFAIIKIRKLTETSSSDKDLDSFLYVRKGKDSRVPRSKLKPCNHKGCKELTRTAYCPKHTEEMNIKRQKNRNYTDRKYNKDRKTRDKEAYMFYHSDEWQSIRKLALVRDQGLCQDCKIQGKVTVAEQVHHIIPIKDNWESRYSLKNLISLCHNCHNRRHNR